MNCTPLIVLAIIQIVHDKGTIDACERVPGKLLLILHHLFSIYILFGGYFFNPKCHLMVVSFSFLVHLLNGKICPITVVNNRMCGFGNDQQLQTLLNVVVPDKQRVVCLYYLLLLLAFVFDIKKVFF